MFVTQMLHPSRGSAPPPAHGAVWLVNIFIYKVGVEQSAGAGLFLRLRGFDVGAGCP